MANRFPLVFDATQNKRIEELPTGDNLTLSGSSLTDVIDITGTGTLTVPNINATSIKLSGTSLSAVATSNNYNDLSNLPTLFSGDYNDLTNKPILTPDWADITNKPIIATKLSQLVNDTSFVTNTTISILPNQVTGLASIATSGSFNDLSDVPDYILASQLLDDTLTIEVTNTGDLVGSVFADDSTLMVDHLNNEVIANKIKTDIIEANDISILAPGGIFIETAQFLTLRTQSFEITNNNFGTVIEDQDIIRFVGNIDFANATVTGLTGQSIVGDLKGSVFGDDSTTIVDAVNNNIEANIVTANVVDATSLKGNLSKIGSSLDITSDSGIQLLPNGFFNVPNATSVTIAGSQGISITATNNLTLTSASGIVDFTNSAVVDFTGVTVTGLEVTSSGDVQGSVFADNSTLLVDGVNATIPAENISGTFTGISSPALTTTSNLSITSGNNLTQTAVNNITIQSTSNGVIAIGNAGNGGISLGSGTNTITIASGSSLDISDLTNINFANSTISNLNGSSVVYTATTPTDWFNTTPTTIQDAIDRLAAWATAQGGDQP